MRKRILFISPHLSTGGLPQYLAKKIQNFISDSDVFCVEYNYYGPEYVVQRNKISNLLGDRFFAAHGKGEMILEIISSVKPDVIHFEEICESFISDSILIEIFRSDREYSIFETCHSSTMDPKSKVFRPDKFIMVSPWIAKKFSSLGVEMNLLEYPIEDFTPDKTSAIQALEFDPELKHVLNVGLFTPGKNQRETMDLASKFLDLPVQFHFVGNRAPNFKDYWEPLLSSLPSNCKIWGERSDVDLFYQAADLFLFTSNLELNPLCLKEALSWKLPVFCKRLPAYLDSYDSNSLVSYLKGDLEKDAEKMKKLLFH